MATSKLPLGKGFDRDWGGGVLEAGTRIAHYEIVRRLGAGGMAAVYDAMDIRLGRHVALKVVVADGADIDHGRFLTEARAVARLEHESVVPLYDFGETSDFHWFAMRLCPGGDLRTRLRSGPLSVGEALEIAKSVASALAHAHAHSIIHRDVKPANILFDQNGRAVIADFGIARMLDRTALTSQGTTIGTVLYMSPEQVRGKALDGRSDIYSLGAVLFEMVAGEPPFKGEPASVMYQHVAEKPPRLPVTLSVLQVLLDRMLAKNPDDRPKIDQLMLMIDDLLQQTRGEISGPPGAELSTVAREPLPLDTAEQVRIAHLASRQEDREIAGEYEDAPVAKDRTRSAFGIVVLGLILGACGVGYFYIDEISSDLSGRFAKPEALRVDRPAEVARTSPQLADSPLPVSVEVANQELPADLGVAPSPTHAPDPRIEQLEARFAVQLAKGRLSRPAGDNALETLEELLVASPGHSLIAQGRAQVAEAYIALAEQKSSAGDFALAHRAIELAASLGRDVSELKSRVAALETLAKPEPTSTQQVAGHEQREDWRRRLAEFRTGEVFKDCDKCPSMVRVPTGHFEMGSTIGSADEQPVHSAWINYPLAVGRYEVTQAEWAYCVDAGACERLRSTRDQNADQFPVTQVDWEQANSYAVWLSQTTGARYRLPSETEWEYFTKAGTVSDFSFGKCISPNAANYDRRGAYLGCGQSDDLIDQARVVGSFAPNPWGLFDVHGNVWEWVLDCWVDNYSRTPRNGAPVDDRACKRRGARGGSWAFTPRYLRSSSRYWFDSKTSNETLGFRVVLDGGV